MAVDKAGPKDWSDLFEACPHLEEKVIQLLDLESALTCRMVCQSWRDMIAEDKKLKTRIRQTSILKAVRLGPLSTNVVAKYTDVNKIYRSGWTPLGFAIKSGRTEVVQTLLSQGADVNKRDHIAYYIKDVGHFKGFTPIYHAVMNGHSNIVMLLIKKGAKIDKNLKSFIKKDNLEMHKLLKRSSAHSCVIS